MILGHVGNPGNASHALLDSREVPIKSWEKEWQPLENGISLGLESCISSFVCRLLIFCALKLLYSGDGQARDRGTAGFPSFMHVSFLFPTKDLYYISCRSKHGLQGAMYVVIIL